MEKSPSGAHLIDITDSEVQVNCCHCLPTKSSKKNNKKTKSEKGREK